MLQLEFSSNEPVIEDHNASDESIYHMRIEGRLIEQWFADNGASRKKVVGRVRALLLLQQAATQNGCDLFQVTDSIDQDTHDMWCSVMGYATDRFRSEPEASLNILYPRSMEILPGYRRKGLGHFILRQLLLRYGRSGLCVIEPHPLSISEGASKQQAKWHRDMKYELFEQDTAVAQRSLQRHWEGLGFQPVPGENTRYWYLALEGRGIENDIEDEVDGFVLDGESNESDEEGGIALPSLLVADQNTEGLTIAAAVLVLPDGTSSVLHYGDEWGDGEGSYLAAHQVLIAPRELRESERARLDLVTVRMRDDDTCVCDVEVMPAQHSVTAESIMAPSLAEDLQIARTNRNEPMFWAVVWTRSRERERRFIWAREAADYALRADDESWEIMAETIADHLPLLPAGDRLERFHVKLRVDGQTWTAVANRG